MKRSDSGQAQVESALTLPLTMFAVLGMLQLFMLLQARIVAQYAAYSAVRAGALNKGDCTSMMHAATLVFLPTFNNTETPQSLASAFSQHMQGRGVPSYRAGIDGFDGPIVEIVRERPTAGQIAGGEDTEFDDFTQPRNYVLEARFAFWYHLRIPFADWVMTRMFLAHYRLQNSPRENPLMPAQKLSATQWYGTATGMPDSNGFGPPSLDARMLGLSNRGKYVFPIQVNAVMPMMTPPNRGAFARAECPST